MPGSDFLHLDPTQAPPRDLAGWLTAAIRDAIAERRLSPGVRLPATRTLAADLGVSRGVVVEAYRRLGDEGLVSGRSAAGTIVRELGMGRATSARRDAAIAGPEPAPGGRLPDVSDRTGLIDLSPGLPDLAAFPRATWLRAEKSVLAEATAAELGYGDPRGSVHLRNELSAWLARIRGVDVAPDGLVVVAGVAQALGLLAQVLGRRGVREIAVEEPGSRGARDQLAYWGLRTAPTQIDDQGIRVDAISATAGAVLVTPAHQFPAGVALGPTRRRELLEWAAGGRLVIEDDYDAEHRYDRAPVPALQGAAPQLVAHTGSTSKSLAPGMRLGWLAPPADLLADLVAAKHASDLGSPAVPQLVLARLLAEGSYDRHLRRVRVRQRARRDALVSAIVAQVPSVEVTGLAAGLHLVVRLGADCDDVDVTDRLRDAGVVVHPLSWHRTLPGPPGLVIGYAAQTPDRLTEAVRRLARVLRP